MNKKIIFFDIDGTILDDNKQITQSTRRAIRGLQENGIYTAIATGRGPGEMEWVCEELNINSYVAINGSYAVFNGEEIYLKTMPPEEAIQLTNTVKKNGHAIAFVTHDDTWAFHEDHPLIHSCIETLQMSYPRTEKELHIHRPVNQAIVYCEEEYDQMYRKAHPNLEFIRFHKYGMDAMPKGNSKAVGIKKMIEATGFKIENTYAFGDALNDLEMISFVGYGIAMGNSIAEIKAVADYVTTANTQDGIWNACMELGLLKPKENPYENISLRRCSV